MLEPREADIPALFLVLVVLPLVAYILLGKWSEGAKKRERVSLLAHLAAEEAFRAEPMATATVIPPMSSATIIPPMSSSNNGHRECARCFSPATTRCSRCKSVRYCSGKCQITHWRQVHKKECLQLDYSSSTSSPRSVLVEESFRDGALLDVNTSPLFSGYNSTQIVMEKPPLDNLTYPFMSGGTAACSEIDTPKFSTLDRRTKEKRLARKSNREMSRREDGTVLDSSEDISGTGINGLVSSNVFPTKEANTTHKLRNDSSHVSEEETSRRHNISNSGEHGNGYTTSRSTMNESYKYQTSHGNSIEPNSNHESLLNEKDAHEADLKCIPDKGNLLKVPIILNDEAVELRRSSEAAAMKGSVNGKISMHLPGNKISRSPKSSITGSGEYVCTEAEGKRHIVDETKIARARQSAHAEGSNGAANTGIMKIMSLRKPAKPSRHDAPEVHCDRHKKMKMLYPYEEFLKMFQFEIVNLMPRGLMNIGNSCYANAVMQCLTCTKPLINYLLHRSHSRSCCARGWCLMCELEQHVMMLREGGGPLSLSRILSRMRSANCQIGNGSQEDAHEFLRLLVSSMQSICLEGLGGESKVDPRLQETTFIQHTFGGRLRSKVKCLGCHHESERYENIMDLTLEIYGWVGSLEDALTQFTTPEDLDGENMYRCGRCAAYVRARKQLSIHEAPNVLTIVLKRFQEGRYGKINKWITFPDLLDMIPFMTGTNDMPPLYLLYAVVVHLDTLNASFSGHYVSYVKDLQGNWFRIDDTEVQQVPMSQVMSEGAYILFYMRSCPRPQRASASKANREQAPASARHCTFKVSRTGQVKRGSDHVGPEPLRDKRPELTMGLANHLSNDILRRSTNRSNPVSMEFSDATSSDWSLFTSSDEASFTTESTRDSFSTVDYADACNDPISSIFNTMYAAPNSVSCRMSSKSRPQTRFVTEEKGYVSSSYTANQPLDDRVHKGDRSKQVSDFSTELHSNVSNCDSFVRYGGNPKNFSVDRTSSHCKL